MSERLCEQELEHCNVHGSLSGSVKASMPALRKCSNVNIADADSDDD